MPKAELKVGNEFGLHARVAFGFTEKGKIFNSDIFVSKGLDKVDGKDVMSLLTLGADHGSLLEIETVGDDEVEALNVLVDYLKDAC